MSQELSAAPVFDGIGYEPSFYSRSQFVPAKTDFEFTNYENSNTDSDAKAIIKTIKFFKIRKSLNWAFKTWKARKYYQESS